MNSSKVYVQIFSSVAFLVEFIDAQYGFGGFPLVPWLTVPQGLTGPAMSTYRMSARFGLCIWMFTSGD